jgi:hypothetical protein
MPLTKSVDEAVLQLASSQGLEEPPMTVAQCRTMILRRSLCRDRYLAFKSLELHGYGRYLRS